MSGVCTQRAVRRIGSLMVASIGIDTHARAARVIVRVSVLVSVRVSARVEVRVNGEKSIWHNARARKTKQPSKPSHFAIRR